MDPFIGGAFQESKDKNAGQNSSLHKYCVAQIHVGGTWQGAVCGETAHPLQPVRETPRPGRETALTLVLPAFSACFLDSDFFIQSVKRYLWNSRCLPR